MLTKEECLKALCRIQCGAKRNKKCEDCKCFDTKINPWKCVENTNESLIIRDLIEEHFNPKPLKFEDLKENAYVWDSVLGFITIIGKIEKDKHITLTNDYGSSVRIVFVENRFYPIQIPMLGGNQ